MATRTIHPFPVALYQAQANTSPTANYAGRTETCILTVVSSTWATDPDQQIQIDVQQSFDAGATWFTIFTTFFVPNTFGKGGQLPQAGFQVGDSLGARIVRGVLTPQLAITMGVDLTINS